MDEKEENWERLNKQGFIPGPSETEAEFFSRVAFCLSLEEKIAKSFLPKGEKLFSNEAKTFLLKEPLLTLSNLYDIKPAFSPLFFSNWRLAPWHGGTAWIFQLEEQGPLGSLIQLRKAFYKKTSYLALYERDELLAHELCHVGRMAFDEKKYEELLAFRTSNRFFSRYFGPILQSAKESHLFIFVLVALLLLDLFLLFQGAYEIYLESMWLKFIPFGLIACALTRLSKRQNRLEKAHRQLKGLFTHRAGAMLYRLKDQEIDLFAEKSEEEILSYIKKQNCFRWQWIRSCYLFE